MNEERQIRSNEKKWNKWAFSADGNALKYQYLRKAQGHVIELAHPEQNVKFLDIGCGTGHAVGLAAKSVNYSGNFYGVDISGNMIRKARKNFEGFENLHFIKANSEAIPLPDNFFEIIICTYSFHHYLHPEKAMSEIARLLIPGGKIYILDPIADRQIMRFIDLFIRTFETAHVKFYSSGEYEKLMVNAGLKYTGYNSFNILQKVQIGEK